MGRHHHGRAFPRELGEHLHHFFGQFRVERARSTCSKSQRQAAAGRADQRGHRAFGEESKNIIFVPAFQEGNRPYGFWEIGRFIYPTAGAQNQVAALDLGFCTVNTRLGQGIGDVVGWVGLRWGNLASAWNAMGYPAQPTPNFPFDGQRMWQSEGNQVAIIDNAVQKRGDLTAGSSGGPWFWAGNPNIVNGVKSQFDPAARISTSPVFGDWVGNMFRAIFGDGATAPVVEESEPVERAETKATRQPELA